MDQAADSQLGNISTRGFVETGSNVMIGGFILETGPERPTSARAMGHPSLVGVSGALADPTFKLMSNGALIMSNDNWRESQQAEIEQTAWRRRMIWSLRFW